MKQLPPPIYKPNLPILPKLPLSQKWHEYLLIYGLINIYLLLLNYITLEIMYMKLSEVYVSDFSFDGSDFSPIINFILLPVFLIIIVIGVSFFISNVCVAFLGFKHFYFKTEVEAEEKLKLYLYIKIIIAILTFLILSIMVLLYEGSRTVFSILLYLPVPITAYILIGLRVKSNREQRQPN